MSSAVFGCLRQRQGYRLVPAALTSHFGFVDWKKGKQGQLRMTAKMNLAWRNPLDRALPYDPEQEEEQGGEDMAQHTPKKAPEPTNDDHRYRRTLRLKCACPRWNTKHWPRPGPLPDCNSLARHVGLPVSSVRSIPSPCSSSSAATNNRDMQVLAALCRIGSNVNQIARQLNRYDPKSAEVLGGQLQAVKSELAQIAVQQQAAPKGQP